MADNRRKSPTQPYNGLLIVIGVCLFLMLISSVSSGFNTALRNGINRVLMPMQRGMNNAGSLISSKLENMRDLNGVQDENEALKEEIAMLREENARLELELSELEALRKLMSLSEQYPEYATVGAHVIGKNSGNWYQSFLIDKGTQDGLAINMNVLADGGLVGIITSIGDNYATVTSIINDNRYISASSARTGSNFIVSGDLTLYTEGKLRMESINRSADIQVGDTVVTSTISEYYLPGLLIGYVSSVSMDSNQLQKSGTLTPVANFDDLDHVLVITTLKDSGN